MLDAQLILVSVSVTINKNIIGLKSMLNQFNLPGSWQNKLAPVTEQDSFKALLQFLEERRLQGVTLYPPASKVFNAFQLTDYNQVKVVIIGQDPYHGPDQAHGLSFSVMPGNPIPPSLKNIYQELTRDVDFKHPGHGCLEQWASQGVLLLNSVLTVEAGNPNSHRNKGWEELTDAVIDCLNADHESLVFLLWGSYAQKKGARIDPAKHLVLKAPHPSPLSAHRGFIGCGHFSMANEYLQSKGLPSINWQL